MMRRVTDSWCFRLLLAGYDRLALVWCRVVGKLWR